MEERQKMARRNGMEEDVIFGEGTIGMGLESR